MIIGYFLNVAIDSSIIIQYSNNAVVLLQPLIGHLCCLGGNRRNKVSVFPAPQHGDKQATPSQLSIGNESPLQAYL